MGSQKYAQLIVFFSSAICNCAGITVYPVTQEPIPTRNGTVKPEPRKWVMPTIKMKPDHSETIKLNESVPEEAIPIKPEPKGIQSKFFFAVPRRRPHHHHHHHSSRHCSQNYVFNTPGQSAILESPNYPGDYPSNVRSSTCFSSPTGTTMTLACDDFNVEYSRSCAYDYFGVAVTGNPSSIQKFCGRGSMKAPSSQSNKLAVVFRSDYSNPGSWRREPFRFKCTVTVSGSSGSEPTTTLPPPVSGNCTCGQRNDGTKIVGGENARTNEFPWRCYLRTNRYQFFCGCSLISNKWVLTAAHCTAAVRPLPPGDSLYVVVGDHDRSVSNDTSSQQIPVLNVHDNKAYNDITMDSGKPTFNISLLELNTTVNFTNGISPVCLPFKYVNDDFRGAKVMASGWGTTTQGGSVSNILQKIELPVLTTQQCQQYYPGQINERMLCTYAPGIDTCQGDSGGSIDLGRGGRYYHIGVVSWGIGCAQRNNPGVYAKTTRFLDWIRSTTGESFCQA